MSGRGRRRRPHHAPGGSHRPAPCSRSEGDEAGDRRRQANETSALCARMEGRSAGLRHVKRIESETLLAWHSRSTSASFP